MYKFYSIFIACLIFGSCNYAYAQPAEKLTAAEYLAEQDYNHALEEYLKLYKGKKTDPEINYNIGFCYLNINDDKGKALPYLEFAYSKGGYKDELLLYLGMSNMYAYKFDDAIKYYTEFKVKVGPKRSAQVPRLIENCENAKILVKSPLNVTFENLGKEINSKFPDYYPFVMDDQSTLYYTTRREGKSQKLRSWQGYFTSDIYFSKVVAGEWTKPKSIGPMINTVEDEQCVYISPDGKRMIIYMDNENASGDLFLSTITGKAKTFPKPVLFEAPINTAELELEGCITEDGSMLIISSDRLEGVGETDLYMFKKLPSGIWSDAVNLGPNINTIYKEAFPVYDEASATLYFASEGHSSMGGSDIFKSKYDESTQTFGPAVNMGYPINTPEENLEFTLAGNKRDGYVSAVRKEGYGDLDIYKVVFNDVEAQTSVIKGIVSTNDSIKKDIDAVVSIVNATTKEKIDSTSAHVKSGKYLFSVNPGKYIITVTSPGYEDVKENINVYDKSDYIFEIEKNITLYKPGTSPTPAVNGAKGAVKPVTPPPPKKK
ncbi:MAG: hypothetical protein V4608_08540 [Bacteroidota bacterium]